jgi:uncharacterized membrane protein
MRAFIQVIGVILTEMLQRKNEIGTFSGLSHFLCGFVFEHLRFVIGNFVSGIVVGLIGLFTVPFIGLASLYHSGMLFPISVIGYTIYRTLLTS